MKRLLAAIALFSLSFLPTLHAADWSGTVKQVEKSIVFLQVGSDGGCTAFVINQEKHYLLTAGHCYGDDHTDWADGVPTDVIYLDNKRDLMVLQAKNIDPTKAALHLAAKNPAIGEEVMSAGYGYALERPFFRQAHIQDNAMKLPDVDGGPFISTDTAFVPGQSGGPVVNNAGEVVMIVQRGDGGTTGLGIGVETIRQYVGRFFGK